MAVRTSASATFQAPGSSFMLKIVRELTASDGVLVEGRFLICDRDQKWSAGMCSSVAVTWTSLPRHRTVACLR
jgi:hypothetical protein